MERELVPYIDSEGREIRVIKDEQGDPWFVAKDVAEALGYVWNGSQMVTHVPEEWKGVRSVLTTFGAHEMIMLSEPGLYFFLGRSDKPGALPMQKWLASEVLPKIRKYGVYSVTLTKSLPELHRMYADELEQKEKYQKQLI